MSGSIVSVPSFSSTVIQKDRSDGYWIQAFHFSKEDKVPGLVVSGLASGRIDFLDNPLAASQEKKATTSSSQTGSDADANSTLWKQYEVAKFDGPVAVITADITRNGLDDLIVCHNYGATMLDCDPNGGWISWLENPGRDKLAAAGHWTQRRIGRWPAMHRLRAGHFTQSSILEIIAASVVCGPHDKVTPVPIMRFVEPDDVLHATEWKHDIVDDKNFTIIHEIVPKKINGPNDLDSLLVASREGVSWLYFDTPTKTWKHERLDGGVPREPGQSATSETPGTGDHWGTGAVDAGRVGADPFAYIATMDPFHGTAVTAYTKTDRGLARWRRHVLDEYGTPNQARKNGDGPGHYVVCGDFDGDGDDEFLVSLMGPLDRDEQGNSIQPAAGPNPSKGIFYYKAIDLENGIFAKWRIAAESSARIALGDFAGKGKLDVASICYNVPQYYEEPNPVVTLHLNESGPPASASAQTPAILTSVWDGEGIVYVADPATRQGAAAPASAALIEVANIAIRIEIYAPRARIPVAKGEGVKVLYGALVEEGGNSNTRRQPLGGAPFPAVASTECPEGSVLSADAVQGAVLLRFTPVGPPPSDKTGYSWAAAADVPVRTVFDVSRAGLELPTQKFVKVDELWWGAGFKGLDFYNLSGFHVRFLDSKLPLAHLQFWVAGPNVNCGTHNHSGDMFEEIHVSLSLGTQTGGMSCLKPRFEDLPFEEITKLPEDAYEHVPLPRLYEHGKLWHCDSHGQAMRRKKDRVVEYPWHKWQAGGGDGVDVWMAIEFNPDLNL